LNQLCDHALLLTFVQEAPRVTRGIVDDALTDLRQLPLHWNESLGLADEFDAAAAAVESESENIDAWDEQMDKSESAIWINQNQITEAAAAFEIGGDDGIEPILAEAPALPTIEALPTESWSAVTATEPIAAPSGDGETVSIMLQDTAGGVRVF